MTHASNTSQGNIASQTAELVEEDGFITVYPTIQDRIRMSKDSPETPAEDSISV